MASDSKMIEPWMLITVLMIGVILFLVGCTHLDTTDKDINRFRIHVKGTVDECQVWVGQQIELTIEDESLMLENPTGD